MGALGDLGQPHCVPVTAGQQQGEFFKDQRWPGAETRGSESRGFFLLEVTRWVGVPRATGNGLLVRLGDGRDPQKSPAWTWLPAHSTVDLLAWNSLIDSRTKLSKLLLIPNMKVGTHFGQAMPPVPRSWWWGTTGASVLAGGAFGGHRVCVCCPQALHGWWSRQPACCSGRGMLSLQKDWG